MTRVQSAISPRLAGTTLANQSLQLTFTDTQAAANQHRFYRVRLN
jgi:hypothetical protein